MMAFASTSNGIWTLTLSSLSPTTTTTTKPSYCKHFSPPISTVSHSQYPHKNHVPECSNTVADKVLADIQNSGIIACLRAQSAEVAIEAARAALRGGITVLEVVMSTPGVFEVLRCLVQEYPSNSIGVGTVLDIRDAKDAIRFGAKFLMSPAMVKDILDDVAEGQALYIPGVMTPTEILFAYNAGAKIVKVYPVSALGGVKYISALMKPFPHIPMVASQGITIDSVGHYIDQGASSVVLSDAIFNKEAMGQKNFDRIKQLAHLAASQGNEAVKRLNVFVHRCSQNLSRRFRMYRLESLIMHRILRGGATICLGLGYNENKARRELKILKSQQKLQNLLFAAT